MAKPEEAAMVAVGWGEEGRSAVGTLAGERWEAEREEETGEGETGVAVMVGVREVVLATLGLRLTARECRWRWPRQRTRQTGCRPGFARARCTTRRRQ